MIVIDASVLAQALADDGADGDRARRRLQGERLVAPALVDLEVISVMRRAARSGALDERRSRRAVMELSGLPLRRVPHLALLARIWELRDNLSAYDAAYVALAEAIGAPLLTADRKLTRVPGAGCEVELIG